MEEVLESKRWFGWLDLLSIEFGKSHILEADVFLEGMQEYIGLKDFAELEIPLQLVAADFWERQEVVFERERNRRRYLLGRGVDVMKRLGLSADYAQYWDLLRGPAAFALIVIWTATIFHMAPARTRAFT